MLKWRMEEAKTGPMLKTYETRKKSTAAKEEAAVSHMPGYAAQAKTEVKMSKLLKNPPLQPF